MPQVTDNPDGSKTFSVSTTELRVLRDRIVANVPNIKQLMQFVEAAPVRATLDFVKSVLG